MGSAAMSNSRVSHLVSSTWVFPFLEVPLFLIHFNRIFIVFSLMFHLNGFFHYKPSSYWRTSICRNHHMHMSWVVMWPKTGGKKHRWMQVQQAELARLLLADGISNQVALLGTRWSVFVGTSWGWGMGQHLFTWKKTDISLDIWHDF